MKISKKFLLISFIIINIGGCIKFKENILDPSTLKGFLISNCLPYPKKLCPFQTNDQNTVFFVPAPEAAITIGELDPTFGSGGKVTLEINSGYNDISRAIALQPDGKILVAGYANNGTDNDFALVRFNSDGSLDTSFDGDGIVTTDLYNNNKNEYATAIALQPDGKIVVAGYANNGTATDFAVVRYNSDGSLDASFGSGGIVISSISTYDDIINAIVIQPDGKIVVAGYADISGDYDFAVVRFNSNGTLDTSFDGDGIVTLDFGNYDTANAIALQPDGKIIVAGYAIIGGYTDFAVVRYNSDGSLDTSFDGDGIVTTNILDSDNANAIVLQPDGKIVVAGSTYISGISDFVVVRYNSDGSLDTSFGNDSLIGGTDGDGKVTFRIGSHSEPFAMILQPDGKIVVAGNADISGNYDFAVLRFNTDGSLDTSFGENGIVTTDINSTIDVAYAMVLQPDGKIIVAGNAEQISNSDFAIVRYR